ncbi:MAG: leucine--tRNA ligase [Planctomycetota bacterium]
MSADEQHTQSGAQKGRRRRYDARLANEIEPKWQERWDAAGTYRQGNPGDAGFDARKPKFYGLDMFPYPSGAGLHVGHPEGYIGTDILCRFKRMTGHNVLHPMGWDAYGLPAEQYAIQTGVHPAITTKTAIDTYRRQLKRFGFCYDWSREFATTDPKYYRWTQWIFLQIYNAWFDPSANDGAGAARPIAELIAACAAGSLEIGPEGEPVAAGTDGARVWSALDADAQREVIDGQRLAYIGEQLVNWCPKLGTVLANEEVIDGRSERGGFPVHRKPLKQWLFRITKYSDRLIAALDTIDWPSSTRTQQTEWIGRSEGADIDFALNDAPAEFGASLRVFTTRPDTIFGATYMVVAPEHPLVDAVLQASGNDGLREYVGEARNRSDRERQESKKKTGVPLGVTARNPATEKDVPVWVADYVLMGYGHGAIMAVPGQDQRDWDFARTFDLEIVRTVQPEDGFDGNAYLGEGPAMNSGFLDGLNVDDAKRRAIEWLTDSGLGRSRVTYRLRDWLFSRQRYWGEPFPIVWDEDGHHHAVGETTLPVVLPDMEDFKPVESDEPQPTLAKARDWVVTTAGEAGVSGLPADAPVRRETNTMPGWAGSCWYFLRYCDPNNSERLVSEEAERYWMGEAGIDLYIGGSEHAVLHLLYARFWHKVLFDLGHVSTPEPFAKLFHQGMITSWAYQRDDKSLVPIDEVDSDAEGRKHTERATGAAVTRIMAKMSKSLRNVTNPDEIIEGYGADTLRLYEMYMGPLADQKPWNTDDINGMFRFLQRAWRLCVDENTGELRVAKKADAEVERLLHRTIAAVGTDIQKLAFNTAIARMIEFVNRAGSNESKITADQMNRFARLLSPFVPHFTQELWARANEDGFIAQAAWPEFDEAMLKDDEVSMVVQVNGKVRGQVTVASAADKATIESAALQADGIPARLEGLTVRKVIVVPGRLVSIVAN